MTTTTFSKFSLHLDLLPSTQRVQPRIRSVYLTFIKMSYKFPDPSEHFITSFLPPSSHSRTARQFGRNCILRGGQELHLQSATSRTSGDESTLYLPRFIIRSLRTSHQAVYFETLLVDVQSMTAHFKPFELAPLPLTCLFSKAQLNLYLCHDFLFFTTTSRLPLLHIPLFLLLLLPCPTYAVT